MSEVELTAEQARVLRFALKANLPCQACIEHITASGWHVVWRDDDGFLCTSTIRDLDVEFSIAVQQITRAGILDHKMGSTVRWVTNRARPALDAYDARAAAAAAPLPTDDKELAMNAPNSE